MLFSGSKDRNTFFNMQMQFQGFRVSGRGRDGELFKFGSKTISIFSRILLVLSTCPLHYSTNKSYSKSLSVMIAGILKEKDGENRVILLPETVAELIKKKVEVWIESGAGKGAY